jgi:hypothetical protein
VIRTAPAAKSALIRDSTVSCARVATKQDRRLAQKCPLNPQSIMSDGALRLRMEANLDVMELGLEGAHPEARAQRVPTNRSNAKLGQLKARFDCEAFQTHHWMEKVPIRKVSPSEL